MDTSKEYILMCEKAEEIQKEWHPQVGDWVLFDRSSLLKDEKRYFTGVVGIDFQSHYTFAEGGRQLDLNRAIWLPRQDQLQEMVKQQTLLISLKYFCDWALLQDEEFFKTQCDKVASMEQLWLAFVMKEKYQKTWDGKDWIK